MTNAADKRVKKIIEPLFIEMQIVVQDNNQMFHNVGSSVAEPVHPDSLVESIETLRAARVKLLAMRRKLETVADTYSKDFRMNQ